MPASLHRKQARLKSPSDPCATRLNYSFSFASSHSHRCSLLLSILCLLLALSTLSAHGRVLQSLVDSGDTTDDGSGGDASGGFLDFPVGATSPDWSGDVAPGTWDTLKGIEEGGTVGGGSDLSAALPGGLPTAPPQEWEGIFEPADEDVGAPIVPPDGQAPPTILIGDDAKDEKDDTTAPDFERGDSSSSSSTGDNRSVRDGDKDVELDDSSNSTSSSSTGASHPPGWIDDGIILPSQRSSSGAATIPEVYWDTSMFGPCSVECGPGLQYAIPRCMRRERVVEDGVCKDARLEPPPIPSRYCNLRPCSVPWRMDRRCGVGYPAPNQNPISECDPNSAAPCCGADQTCGSGARHCRCLGCVDYRLLFNNTMPGDPKDPDSGSASGKHGSGNNMLLVGVLVSVLVFVLCLLLLMLKLNRWRREKTAKYGGTGNGSTTAVCDESKPPRSLSGTSANTRPLRAFAQTQSGGEADFSVPGPMRTVRISRSSVLPYQHKPQRGESMSVSHDTDGERSSFAMPRVHGDRASGTNGSAPPSSQTPQLLPTTSSARGALDRSTAAFPSPAPLPPPALTATPAPPPAAVLSPPPSAPSPAPLSPLSPRSIDLEDDPSVEYSSTRSASNFVEADNGEDRPPSVEAGVESTPVVVFHMNDSPPVLSPSPAPLSSPPSPPRTILSSSPLALIDRTQVLSFGSRFSHPSSSAPARSSLLRSPVSPTPIAGKIASSRSPPGPLSPTSSLPRVRAPLRHPRTGLGGGAPIARHAGAAGLSPAAANAIVGPESNATAVISLSNDITATASGAAASNNSASNLSPDQTCSICLSARSDALCVPCGHGNFCYSCLSRWFAQTKQCPVCRYSIDGVSRQAGRTATTGEKCGSAPSLRDRALAPLPSDSFSVRLHAAVH